MANRRTWALFVVSILLVGSLIGVFAVKDGSHEIHADLTNRDKYGDFDTNIKASDLLDNGYSLWDCVYMIWDGRCVQSIITTNYLGLYTFEYYINIDDDGTVKISCLFTSGHLDVGKHITIKRIGESHRNEIMPRYCSDICERTPTMTDEQYANLHIVSTTGIKEGNLYRSYNEFAKTTDVRAGAVDPLLKKYDITHLVCLNNTLATLKENVETKKVIAKNGLKHLYDGTTFAKSLTVMFMEDRRFADVFGYIADNDGSYMVFCALGKDRTGFVITVLEALMGATYDEMFEDYAQAYVNLYGIEKGSDEYMELHRLFDPILVALHDPSVLEYVDRVDLRDVDVSSYDYRADAEKFLRNGLGLSSEKIGKIRVHLGS